MGNPSAGKGLVFDFLSGCHKELIHKLNTVRLSDSMNVIRKCQKWVIAQNCEIVKVIPQKKKKKKLPTNFLKLCSPPSIVSKKTIKKIGRHSRLRDMMGQSYPIYAYFGSNHADYSNSCCFRGHNLHVKVTVLRTLSVTSFFPSDNFFIISFF